MKRQVFLTGATGRVGSRLVKQLQEDGYRIRAFIMEGDPLESRIEELGVEITRGDLTDYDSVRSAMDCEPELVFHLAAVFGPGVTPRQYAGINILGTFHVLQSAVEVAPNIRRLVTISTDGVYDKYPPRGLSEPISEDFPVRPTDHNGLSKSICESYGEYYYRMHDLPVTIFRFPYVVSGDELLRFAPFWADFWRGQYPGCPGLESDGPLLVLPRDPQGRAYAKAFVHVRDVVGFLSRAADSGYRTLGETYQLGTFDTVDWEFAVPMISEGLGIPCRSITTAVTHCRYSFDPSKAVEAFGYRPAVDSRQIVAEAIEARKSSEQS